MTTIKSGSLPPKAHSSDTKKYFKNILVRLKKFGKRPPESATSTFERTLKKSLNLPKGVKLRFCEVPLSPAPSPTADDIQRVFNKIIQTQTKEGIQKQKEVNVKLKGVCFLLSELVFRELSNEGYFPVKVSLIYCPNGFDWTFHTSTGVLDSKQNIWMCDPWDSPKNILSCREWVKAHFHKPCVLDISSPYLFKPPSWDQSDLPKIQDVCSDNISKSSWKSEWIELAKVWRVSDPTCKFYLPFLEELEKLLTQNLPKTLPFKIIGNYLGIDVFSPETLSAEATRKFEHLYMRTQFFDKDIQHIPERLKCEKSYDYNPALAVTLYLVKKFPTLIPRFLEDKSLLKKLTQQSEKNPKKHDLRSLIDILSSPLLF